MSAKEPKPAFTVQHRLEDAEADSISAVYRFREAEANGSADYAEAKVAMNEAETKLDLIRYYAYTVTSVFGGLDESIADICSESICPMPEWNQNTSCRFCLQFSHERS